MAGRLAAAAAAAAPQQAVQPPSGHIYPLPATPESRLEPMVATTRLRRLAAHVRPSCGAPAAAAPSIEIVPIREELRSLPLATHPPAPGASVAAMTAQFMGEGYLHLPGCLTPEETTHLRERSDALWRQWGDDVQHPIGTPDALVCCPPASSQEALFEVAPARVNSNPTRPCYLAARDLCVGIRSCVPAAAGQGACGVRGRGGARRGLRADQR